MSRMTREELDAVLPIILKNPDARPDFRLYRNGTGRVDYAKTRAKYWAWRTVNSGSVAMSRTERIQLLQFVTRYPPGHNAAKGTEPLVEQVSFRVTVSEKEQIDRAVDKAKAKRASEVKNRGDWLRRAALLMVRIENGEVDVVPRPDIRPLGDRTG